MKTTNQQTKKERLREIVKLERLYKLLDEYQHDYSCDCSALMQRVSDSIISNCLCKAMEQLEKRGENK